MCELQDMPQETSVPCIRDLIAEFGVWHQYDQAQLNLNLYELSKYYQYAAGGIDESFIKLHEKLPTLLHSAGNQMYTCACGCRAALSEQRLKQKGMVGVLIPLGTTQVHMNVCMRHARYLHPIEMWALMGGHPEVNMGSNLRLAMAGVGQAVAPLMGFWIFAHIRRVLDLALELPPCNPLPLFQEYMAEVIHACRLKWPPATMPCAPTAEDPIEETEVAGLITLSRPLSDESDVLVRVSPGSTGEQLLAAEVKLGNAVKDFQLRVNGEPMNPSQTFPNDALVSLVSPAWTPEQLYAEKQVPCCLDVDAFLHFVRASDAFEPGPMNDLGRLSAVRHPDMPNVTRQSVLAMQGPVWGDDELLFGLHQIADNTDADQCVTVWDPLLISGLVQQDVPATWSQLVAALRPMTTVVSAVLLGGHWIPLVWRIDTVGAKLHTLAVTVDFEPVLDSLCRAIDLYRGGARGVWKAHEPGFVPVGYCGALALCFVRHLLWGWLLVDDQCSLQWVSDQMRKDFAAQLPEPCLRPMLAGLGLTVQARLADLLCEHGVPTQEAMGRATLAIKALGEDGIGKALDSDNQWRELKWLGNQSRPPYMFIKPSELQSQIELRDKDKPVGQKKHKSRPSKGKGKGLSTQLSVDPASLRLETGIFQSEQGQLLPQLGLSQVGPTAVGVVVVSVHTIEPYLKAGNPLSSGPLAFFVVDSPGVPATGFQVSSERIPMVCAVNSEPLLIDGHLIQLGAMRVQRAPLQPGCSVQSIPTCVVKAMIFRDQTQVP